MTSRLLQSLATGLRHERRRGFRSTARLSMFYEKDERGGYPDKFDRPVEDLKGLKKWKAGWEELKKELKLFKKEWKDHFTTDPVGIYRRNEVDVVWRFDGDPEVLDKWVTTCDSDYNEGFSTASLQMTKTGRGLFSGVLDTRVPKDGRMKRAGYCNIKTVRAQKSFKRDCYLDWQLYNHIVFRVRGDGRSYLLTINTKEIYDMLWNDVYNYVLFTRGGPYWQTAKIPFSKFFFASKGRVQDRQTSIPLDQVVSIGITAADGNPGPFKLEIDYIGLEYDHAHMEEFAYEMYRVDKHIAAI